jgi:hypothetical protein
MDVNRALSAWHFPLRKRKLLKKRTTASDSIPVGETHTLNDANNNNNNNSDSDDSNNDDKVNSKNNKCERQIADCTSCFARKEW